MRTIRYTLILIIVFAMSCENNTIEQWISITPDITLKDWKIDGDLDNIDQDNDILKMKGRTSIYYAGEICDAVFRNFELTAVMKTDSGAIGGIWFHSEENSGCMILINNTPTSEELRKTGSLKTIRNIYKSIANDDEWFTLNIKVVKNHITVKVNDILVVDYVQPDNPYRTEENKRIRLGYGTFVLSSYTNNSIMIRSLNVLPLPDDAKPERTDTIDEQTDDIIRLQQIDFPIIDFHVHLKGWNQEQAMANSRRVGIFYGLAPNCGIGFPVTSDIDVYTYLDTTKNLSCFQAMQGEGREWTTTFSKEAREQFDYVFTDAMTFTDHKGRRTRLWIPREVYIDIDQEEYMDLIVDKIVEVLNEEPIDIYVNPTYLPQEMMSDYGKLWTDERINRVIMALVENEIAMEINEVYRLPSEKIIIAAKEAGVRFAFGTNNGNASIGRLAYCIDMMKKCGITKYDMFFPGVKVTEEEEDEE